MSNQNFDMYRGKVILAPMVKYAMVYLWFRVGQLPFRLLALEYGADLVYSEELVDRKLIETKRVVNDKLGTIDYIDKGKNVVYQTCKLEKDRNILQIGTATPKLALETALHCFEDYAGLDVNMG